MKILRIATRKSQLALWQANHVRAQLLERHRNLKVELIEMTTQGDRTLDVPLATVGGKGLFLKELERALLEERADIAVHSMKDVTVTLPDGLDVPVICERSDPRDAFVSNKHSNLRGMPGGARVGTCSLRRRCLCKERFPEFDVIELRGNVNTRLKRLDAGDFEAIILAVCGLQRLGLSSRIREQLNADEFIPAVGQAAIGIECRVDDAATLDLVSPLNHPASAITVRAERAANAALNGGCHVPVAVHARLTGTRLKIRGMVGMPDGSQVLRDELDGSVDDAEATGQRLGERLLELGAGSILKAVYA